MDATKLTVKTIKSLDKAKKMNLNHTGKFKNISGKSATLSIGGNVRKWEKQIVAGTFTYKDSTNPSNIFKPNDVVNGIVLNTLANFYAVLTANPNYIADQAYVYNFNNMLAGPGTEIVNWISKSGENVDISGEYFGNIGAGEYFTIGLVEYMQAVNKMNINVPYYAEMQGSADYGYMYIPLTEYMAKVREDSKVVNAEKNKIKNESTKKRTGGIQKFIFTKATEVKDAPIESIDIVSPSLIKVLVDSIGKKTEASKEKRKGRNVDISQRIAEVMQTTDKILNITGITENGTGIKKVARPASLESGSTDKRRTSDLVPISSVVDAAGKHYVYYKGNQAGISKAIELFGRLSGYDVTSDLAKINRPTAVVTIQPPRIQ